MRIIPTLLLSLVLFSSPAYAGYKKTFNPDTGVGDFVGVSASRDVAVVCDSGKVLKSQGSGTWACDDDTGGVGSGVDAVGDCPSGDCFGGTQGTTLTFNHASGDATQVYDGTTMAFSKAIEMEGGNITYVDCGASISNAVTAATAGDTLFLGSCTYTLSSTLNIDKSLSLVCLNGTRIEDGAAFSGAMINVTDSPFSISNCKLEYDSGATAGIIIDARATNVFSYKDVIIDSISITGSNTVEIEGIRGKDAGMIVINPQIILTTTLAGTEQCRTLFTQVESTAEGDVEVYAIGGGFHKCTVTSAEANTVNKPLFCWNNGADESLNSITCTYENQVAIADNSAADDGYTIAALVEGDRATGNFYGGILDGGRHGSTSQARDLQTDGGTSVANIYGATLRRGYKIENTGVINTLGVHQGSGVYADNVYQAPDHLAAIPVIDMTGSQGGDKPGTGSTTGLRGSSATIALGAGGAATEATVTGTGGPGGGFVLTAGDGAAQTIATSTTNVGGAGGTFELKGGSGGVANSAGTTNTGGVGGDVFIRGGAGGVGTTTTGSDGDVLLAIDSGGTVEGNVGIGTLAPVSRLDVTVDGGTTAANAGKLTLSRNDTSVSSLDRIGQIDFWNNDSSLSTQKLYASIIAFADQAITTDAAAGRLAFQTASTTAGGSPATRMTIRNDGDIGMMTTGPDKALEINSSTGDNLRLTYNDSDGSASNYSDFTVSSGGDLTIAASGGDISLDNENLSGTGIYDLGGATLEVPNSTSLPGTCAVGQIYMDTDATTGQRIYACESSNTWALQGDGGGAGGAPTDATYITQTANGTLSNEQALSSLSTGIMRVATTTGVITSLTDSSGISSNISDETGTGALVFGTAPTLLTADVKNGATSAGYLSIYEDSDDGTNYTRIQAQAQAGNVTYTLPPDDGDAGEQLQTDGSGGLTWEAAGSGGGSAPTTVDYLVGTADGTLSNEIVVGATPGGELGGTWASPTIDDSLAVTSWNLTTPTITTSATVTDDDWIGLGSSAALIQFDDQATDEIEILNANVRIGAGSASYPPATKLEAVGSNPGSGIGTEDMLKLIRPTYALEYSKVAAFKLGKWDSGNLTSSSRLDIALKNGASGTYDADTTVMTILSSIKAGIGTTAPDKTLELNNSSGGSLRLTYNDSNGSAATYSDMSVDSSGDLTVAPSGGDLLVTGAVSASSTITSSATGSLGWSIVSANNQACTTTCTSAAVFGWDTSSGEVAVSASDATADKCLCAGAS